MEYRWNIHESGNTDTVQALAKSLNITPVLANLLVQRGITNFDEARDFFRPNLENLHDPFVMKDMDLAMERLQQALESEEKILVYGDYDVDGTTAVSLVYSFLRELTEQVLYYIPDRYTEGYGVSLQGIDYAKEQGCQLIIALDCGIKAHKQIAYAKEKSIDFIVCDHHLPEGELPGAVAILNPKQSDCPYPFKELCGCGIGFKLVQALCQRYDYPFESLHQYLDLVAIAIACDIVPINGENRILAHCGLHELNKRERPGIQVMLELAKSEKTLTVTDLVFVIGPRINAAGRIEHGKKAVQLLTAKSANDAQSVAETIDAHNTERKDIDKEITEDAYSRIKSDPALMQRKSTVLYDPDWHKGVIGIVASRLIERHYRPTIMLTESNGKATGSARSIKNFDIYRAIEACSDLLEQFGGHKYAAGLTMPIENVPAFQKRFEEVVAERVTDEDLVPVIEVNLEMELEEVGPKFYRILKQLAPFGPGNMKPVFISRKLIDAGYTKKVGAEGDHLKLDVAPANNKTSRHSGIGFGMGHHYDEISRGTAFNLVYSLDENEWRNNVTLQLKVKDLRFDD